jgi:acyl-coenzyme A synthetase/AMP-(fatty) acid ligase
MTFLQPPASFNMTAHVLARATDCPDKTALSIIGTRTAQNWTYGAIRSAILGSATGLLGLGLSLGDRILLRLGNTPDFPITFLACIAVGLVPVPTSAQLTRVEITSIAEGIKPAAVIADPDVALPDYPAPVITTDMLPAFYDMQPAAFDMGDPDRPAYIIYTSGTSGQPRGVVHAHRAIWARQMMFDGWYGLRTDDRVLHAGAFNWTYTLGTGLMDPWTMGATALIPSAGIAPAEMGALIAQHKATIFAAAPGLYRQMLKSRMPPCPTLRHGLSAGEKLPDVTRDAWLDTTSTQIFEAYGMSESSTFISASPTCPAAPGTLGFPQTGRRVAMLAPDGTPDASGQIAIHRTDPGLMLGYLDAPDETAQKFHGDWFLTGDMGHQLPDGAIAYDGRADDMMNAGGYRVSPIEVEQALALLPAIEDVAAVELRVKSTASVIAAFYTSANVIDDDEMARHCAAHLARYKTPRLFIRQNALPRGANNKLLRRALKTRWEADHGQT